MKTVNHFKLAIPSPSSIDNLSFFYHSAIMAEELKVVLKKSENLSFGFSLLGTAAGLPHVIYDIMENSPAAECGEVSTNS